MHGRTFANFDTKTGQVLKLADVLIPGYRPRLTLIAEKKFRESNGLKPADSLSQAGYKFPHDTFALNDNFSIGAKGMTFYYNTYEIASYAVGPTELLLTYHEIRDLIKPDRPLGLTRVLLIPCTLCGTAAADEVCWRFPLSVLYNTHVRYLGGREWSSGPRG